MFDEKHRAGHLAEHSFRDAAQEQSRKPRPAVCAHYDHVHLGGNGRPDDFFDGIPNHDYAANLDALVERKKPIEALPGQLKIVRRKGREDALHRHDKVRLDDVQQEDFGKVLPSE